MAQTFDTNQMTEFSEPVRADLESFATRLNDYLQGDSPLITSIARHLLKSRGKRIRPVFLFLSSRAANNFTEHSVDASLAIELIHTATLLHDDVVDESDLRRGVQTINAKWTNLISVLMGDYLFAKAFRIMVRSGSVALMEAVSRATERVSIGELRQIEETGNYDLSEDEYLSIIADKTASLFNVSCESGPILNQRDNKEREAFARFGEDIGTAFQIADDLLDFVGDAEVTGKEPGNDVLTGKVTLPLIYALQKTGKAATKEITAYLDKGVGNPESFGRIHTFVAENGGIDYAYRRADELTQRGMDAISNVEPSIYLQSLTHLVRFTTSRVA